ncbi:MAG: phosphate/phosphite/phosphonate ABC transporter substrate-binding protein [Anaerolineae bacterium]|nr:phosphate/phosphite/phosphonate ABC transporter substrate-binding protein [Anaerolineae bacterium]
MTKKLFSVLLVAALALPAMLLVPGVAAQDGLGTADNPIQVFFVPSGEAATIVEGGEVLADVLKEATGYEYEVFVPTSYAATIEAMCAAPGSTIGFIPAAGYVIANNRCGVEVAAAAVRYGWPAYWAEYIVRRDSDIYTFGDLEGKTWGYGDPGSTSGYIVPSVELQAAGITPGEEVQTGGHNQTVLAVYNGEVDFGTVYFSPPLTPGAPWGNQDLPEPYDLTIDESYINADGDLYVGDIRIMDARNTAAETAPDIVDQVRILAISAAIPNDTLSFGPEFPAEIRSEIMAALFALAGDEEAWNSTALYTAYNWTGLAEMDDSAFDSVRLQFEILGLTEEDIFGG